jgi:hypothetical protein
MSVYTLAICYMPDKAQNETHCLELVFVTRKSPAGRANSGLQTGCSS